MSVHETMSSHPAPLIVTTMAPPLPPVAPLPAVTVPESCPDAPSQMMMSLPALTTGLAHGGVGQLME